MMSEEFLILCADVRAKLYGCTIEELKPAALEVLPLFDVTKATRAKTLSVFEELISKVTKEEDGGIAKLTTLSDKLKVKVKPTESATKETVKVEVKEESKSDSGTKETASKVVGTYSFRKDFKILGQLGDPKTCLSFTSFRRQVEDGQGKGYKDSEIIEGIIRAIQPQNKLRSYLEGRPSLDLHKVISIIRSYYKEHTATELYQQLSTLAQETRKTPQDFLFRALDLRQRVIFASKEKTGSAMTYDDKLVQSMTLHALSTGMKDENIRHSFDITLAKEGVSDEELISALNTITAREQERHSKLDRKGTRVNQIETTDDKEVKEKKPFTEGKLNADLKALKAEVDQLRQEMGKRNPQPMGPDQERKKRTFRQCRWCEENKSSSKCDHCFKCGSSEHFSRGCRQKNSTQQEN